MSNFRQQCMQGESNNALFKDINRSQDFFRNPMAIADAQTSNLSPNILYSNVNSKGSSSNNSNSTVMSSISGYGENELLRPGSNIALGSTDNSLDPRCGMGINLPENVLMTNRMNNAMEYTRNHPSYMPPNDRCQISNEIASNANLLAFNDANCNTTGQKAMVSNSSPFFTNTDHLLPGMTDSKAPSALSNNQNFNALNLAMNMLPLNTTDINNLNANLSLAATATAAGAGVTSHDYNDYRKCNMTPFAPPPLSLYSSSSPQVSYFSNNGCNSANVGSSSSSSTSSSSGLILGNSDLAQSLLGPSIGHIPTDFNPPSYSSPSSVSSSSETYATMNNGHHHNHATNNRVFHPQSIGSNPMAQPNLTTTQAVSKAKRGKRTVYNQDQKIILERYFLQNNYPNKSARICISQELFLDEPRIKIWFKNRRAKSKKSIPTRCTGGDSSSSSSLALPHSPCDIQGQNSALNLSSLSNNHQTTLNTLLMPSSSDECMINQHPHQLQHYSRSIQANHETNTGPHLQHLTNSNRSAMRKNITPPNSQIQNHNQMYMQDNQQVSSLKHTSSLIDDHQLLKQCSSGQSSNTTSTTTASPCNATTSNHTMNNHVGQVEKANLAATNGQEATRDLSYDIDSFIINQQHRQHPNFVSNLIDQKDQKMQAENYPTTFENSIESLCDSSRLNDINVSSFSGKRSATDLTQSPNSCLFTSLQ